MVNPPENNSPENNNENHDPAKKFKEMLPFEASTKDLVAYILMVLGIILLFFMPIYGGLLIGIVAGVYFSKEIIPVLKDLSTFIEDNGIARSIILAGITLAFFIVAPAIFIGAALVICLRWFVFNDDNS
jgi:hypothetical protein